MALVRWHYASYDTDAHECLPLEAHHERQKEQYASNPNVDTARSKRNFHLIKPKNAYKTEIDACITAAKCRTRKDSTRFVDTLITASNSFFKGKNREEIKAYFAHANNFLCERVGRHNVVSAVIHIDEKTPHMHITFVPLTADNRLCAKEILGNRADLSRWQDDFHAHMVKKYPGFERGEPSRETGRRHIPMRIFKQAANLTRQAQKIETLLADKNPLTARKRQEEAAILLNKWFPQMEDFEGYLKKYKSTISYLQKENTDLENELETTRDNKIGTRLKIGKLESELNDLRRFKAAVPEDVRKRAEVAMRHGKQQKSRDDR